MTAVNSSSGGAEVRAGWTYHVVPRVASTNTYAARLAPWTAVRAVMQTAGRGRTPDRRWLSDEGGLWLSAVLPCPPPRARWETLPLAAGWAVMNALHALGVMRVRLRWPNDIMVAEAKLAGLLVERYTDETAVVGIGLNVANRPDTADPALAGRAARLSDFTCARCSLDEVAEEILDELRSAHETILASGFLRIADELNHSWRDSAPIELTLLGRPQPVSCRFHGVDRHGRLRVTLPGGEMHVYRASEVERLREVSGD